jgi:hypothetical protein
MRAWVWFIEAKGPARSLRGLVVDGKDGLETSGDRAIRAALRRNRAVAMPRVVCHEVERIDGVIRVGLIWHRRHIEERIGSGILPEIKVARCKNLRI